MLNLLIFLTLIFIHTSVIAQPWQQVENLEGGYTGGRFRQGITQAGSNIYAMNTSHLFRSTDNGNTWEEARQELLKGAIDIATTNTAVFCITMNNARGGFFRSLDNGQNWELPLLQGLPAALDQDNQPIRIYYHLAATSNRVFVVFRDNINLQGTILLYVSDDNGDNWQQVDTVDSGQGIGEIIFPTIGIYTAGNSILWSSGSKFKFSHDEAHTVQAVFNAFHPGGVRLCFLGTALYAIGGDGKLYRRSTEPDDTFTLVTSNDLPPDFFGLYLTAQADEINMIGIEINTNTQFLYRSTDQGASWQRFKAEGLPQGTTFNLIKSENSYIASSMNGIYRSDDGGETFFPTNKGLHAFGTNDIFSTRPSFIGASGKALVVQDYATAPAMQGEANFQRGSIGLMSSIDEGNVWSNNFSLLPKNYNGIVASDSLIITPAQLYLFKEGKIYSSTDGAISWNSLSLDAMETQGLLSITPLYTDNNTLYIKAEYNNQAIPIRYYSIDEMNSIRIWDFTDIEVGRKAISGNIMIHLGASLASNSYSLDKGKTWNPLEVNGAFYLDGIGSIHPVNNRIFIIAQCRQDTVLPGTTSTTIIKYTALLEFTNNTLHKIGHLGQNNIPQNLSFFAPFQFYHNAYYVRSDNFIYYTDDLANGFQQYDMSGLPKNTSIAAFSIIEDKIYVMMEGLGLFRKNLLSTSVTERPVKSGSTDVSLSTYPNPASSYTTVKLPENNSYYIAGNNRENATIQIFSLTGTRMFVDTILSDGKIYIYCDQLTNGFYTAHIMRNNNVIGYCTFIVSH